MRPRILTAVLAIICASCSSALTTPTPVNPSTFVMTWPTLAFPSTGLGGPTTAPVVITLWNSGTTAVPVASVSDDNLKEFPWTSTCSVGGSLPANSTCNVTVQFTPNQMGAQSSTLTINANSLTQTFALSGTGIAPVNPHIVLSPASGPPSTVFTLTITGLTPSAQATLYTTYTPAPGNPAISFAPTTWTVDASGNLTVASTSDALGTYENWIVDLTSQVSSNHVVHTVQ